MHCKGASTPPSHPYSFLYDICIAPTCATTNQTYTLCLQGKDAAAWLAKAIRLNSLPGAPSGTTLVDVTSVVRAFPVPVVLCCVLSINIYLAALFSGTVSTTPQHNTPAPNRQQHNCCSVPHNAQGHTVSGPQCYCMRVPQVSSAGRQAALDAWELTLHGDPFGLQQGKAALVFPPNPALPAQLWISAVHPCSNHWLRHRLGEGKKAPLLPHGCREVWAALCALQGLPLPPVQKVPSYVGVARKVKLSAGVCARPASPGWGTCLGKGTHRKDPCSQQTQSGRASSLCLMLSSKCCSFPFAVAASHSAQRKKYGGIGFQNGHGRMAWQDDGSASAGEQLHTQTHTHTIPPHPLSFLANGVEGGSARKWKADGLPALPLSLT